MKTSVVSDVRFFFGPKKKAVYCGDQGYNNDLLRAYVCDIFDQKKNSF